jgi:hypothetical protein
MTVPDFTFSEEKNRLEAWDDGRAFLLYVFVVAEQIILEQTKVHSFLDALRRIADTIPDASDVVILRFEQILRSEPFAYPCLWRDLSTLDVVIGCATAQDFVNAYSQRFI